ncbi:MAG: hypothetical protein J7501_17655 [Bdellovibrio sp.]|nr:hypothetical protein [Bdellovibrio sp.]
MPEKAVVDKAKKKARQGLSPSTQAGEFVKSEIDTIRSGKHGARSTKQAIAIGLSEARRAGVKVPKNPNAKSASSKSKVKRKASSETTAQRKKAALKALKREPTSTVSRKSLSKFAKAAARKRGPSARKASAAKAVRTKRMHA